MSICLKKKYHTTGRVSRTRISGSSTPCTNAKATLRSQNMASRRKTYRTENISLHGSRNFLVQLHFAGWRLRVNNSDAKTNNQAWAGIFWLIWSVFCAIISPTSPVMKLLCDKFYVPRSRWHARMVTSIVTTGQKMTNARRILNGIFQMSPCPISLSFLKLPESLLLQPGQFIVLLRKHHCLTLSLFLRVVHGQEKSNLKSQNSKDHF